MTSKEDLRWAKLTAKYLPYADRFWRFSRASSEKEPRQGFKFHLSAHASFSVELLRRVAPILRDRDLLFKAPKQISYVTYLNSGINFGFSQVGKIITIYPSYETDVVELGRILVTVCEGIRGPDVPTDFRLSNSACVFVRYGSFLRGADGSPMALITPDGSEEPDLRPVGRPFPTWIENPFATVKSAKEKANLLATRFLAYRALSQRGKGGVYQALDISAVPATLCVLKEARLDGEAELDDRPAFERLRHEARVLRLLKRKGVQVPELLETFQLKGHRYLAIQYIPGENLQTLLGKRKLNRRARLRVAASLSKELEKIHRSGWAWRDLKPSNIIRTRLGEAYLIDFEGSCRIQAEEPFPWGTRSYMPHRAFDGPNRHRMQDVFALAVTLMQIIEDRSYPLQKIDKQSAAVPGPLRDLCLAAHQPANLAHLTVTHFSEVLESLNEAHAR